MSEAPDNPLPFDVCPPQMTGEVAYFQAVDGKWYAAKNLDTGELFRWPSMAILGLPEQPIGTHLFAMPEFRNAVHLSDSIARFLADAPAIVEAR